MLRLTERQARLLLSFELQPARHIDEAAKELGLKPHTIRRELKLLRDNNVLRQVVVINPATFGYQTYEIAFSTSTGSALARHDFITDLMNSGSVSLVLETAGEFEFFVSLLARNAGEVFDLFVNLEQRHGLFLTDRRISISLMFKAFGRKYLAPEIDPGYYDEPRVSDLHVTLDKTDHEILSALASTPYDSLAAVARTLKLSPSSFNYRLKKLREKEVVTNLVYFVNGKMLGSSHFVFKVVSRTMSHEFRDKFSEFCRKHPNVVFFSELLGSWNFNVSVEVADAHEIPEVVLSLKQAFRAEIQKILVVPVLHFHSVRTYPFKQVPV